jgi:asparagine synthase (glutamine-hydrolysing)
VAAIFKGVETGCAAGVLDRMTDCIEHRGPNSRGVSFFAQKGYDWRPADPNGERWTAALGNRRLSIIDLSASGHQPMTYRDRACITYNGEVYNHVELRAELERRGHVFRSRSDTEVVLAAYDEWGPECFARMRGMWGIILVDLEKGEAILSRDRLGIKPLHLWEGEGILAVVSEIKQLMDVPGFRPVPDTTACAEFLRTGYEDPRRTFFAGVRPLPAGTWQRLCLRTLKASAPEPYWHPENVREEITDPDEAAGLFSDKLRESVRIHLRSDVPVGCALSGGLDSSAITALAAAEGILKPLHTFTCTFPGDPRDERPFVDEVLRAVPAAAHFVTPTPDGFLADLDRFTWIHDEPVGSVSQYAGYCVARLAREAGVPVVLSGQGSDEMLSGYWVSYFMHLRDLARGARIIELAKHLGGAALPGGNSSLLEQVPVTWRRYRGRRSHARLGLLGPFREAHSGILDDALRVTGSARRIHELRVMFLPRLLKWDDRNSMAFSIEGRYPFLDHELIELTLRFAPKALYRRGWTKLPIRLGLKSMPAATRWRRSKFGFETPQGSWLAGSLRPSVEQWLTANRPVWEYVDRADARRIANIVWARPGRDEEAEQALFRALVFDRWLQVFGLRF